MVPFRVWSLAWKVRTTHTDITPFRQQRKHFCCLEKKTEIRSWALKLKQKSSLHEGYLLSLFHQGAKPAPRVKASCGSGFWAELPTAQLSTTSFAAPSPLPHHLAVVPGVPEGSGGGAGWTLSRYFGFTDKRRSGWWHIYPIGLLPKLAMSFLGSSQSLFLASGYWQCK